MRNISMHSASRTTKATPLLNLLSAVARTSPSSSQMSRILAPQSHISSRIPTMTRKFTPDYTAVGEFLGPDLNYQHSSLYDLVDYLADFTPPNPDPNNHVVAGKDFDRGDILNADGAKLLVQKLEEWNAELSYIVRSTCEWRHMESAERDHLNSWEWERHWTKIEADGAYYNLRDYAFTKIEEGMEYSIRVRFIV